MRFRKNPRLSGAAASADSVGNAPASNADPVRNNAVGDNAVGDNAVGDNAVGDNPMRITATPGRRSLRQRLPIRLRQNWKILAVVLVMLLVLVLGFGSVMVRPTITSELATKDELRENIQGTSDFFDTGEHSISISYNPTEYQDMIKEFQTSGEKNFIRAEVTIDGTLIENVGIRMKGNSTLMSLRSQDGRSQEGGVPQNQGPNGQGAPQQGVGQGVQQGVGQGVQQGVGQGAGPAGGPPGTAQLSFDEPESLPWLLSFDEYVEGRAYQGHTELSLRPAVNNSSTAVNEALALALTRKSGQITQDYTVASVSINGGTSRARLVVDHPDAQWASELGNGVLYKAKASGSMDYLGDDLTEYENSFKQINAKGTYDLKPVMSFLDFVNNSSDEDFAATLSDYLDVNSFATYLATQSLLSNMDAMDGPGNNYYLWYNADKHRFTVLSWDLNMALGTGIGGGMRPGMGAGNPADMGGNPPNVGGNPANMAGTPSDMGANPPNVAGNPAETGGAPADMGDNFVPPNLGENFVPPDFGGDFVPPNMGGNAPPMGEGQDFQGPGRGSGILKERFLKVAKFAELYEKSYANLYKQLIDSGYAEETLNDVVTRASGTGDTGAEPLGETVKQKLENTSSTSTAEQAAMSSMRPKSMNQADGAAQP